MRFAPALAMADHTITYRLIVKEIAKKAGHHATFMPKPLFGENGSGMHTHQSLFTDGRNAFVLVGSSSFVRTKPAPWKSKSAWTRGRRAATLTAKFSAATVGKCVRPVREIVFRTLSLEDGLHQDRQSKTQNGFELSARFARNNRVGRWRSAKSRP